MDALLDVLRGVRLTGALFYDLQAHSPWVGTTPSAAVIAGLVMPKAEHVICFHVVVSGSCWAELAGEPIAPVRLQAGDVVVIAKGDTHYLSSSPGMRGEPDPAAYRRPPGRALPLPYVLNETGEGSEICHFLCGILGCDLRPFNPLLHTLPRMFRGQASAAIQSWLLSLLSTAVDQMEDNGIGREIMLAKLAELIFVDVLWKYISALPDDSRSWFSGLRDRHVGAALRAIHEKPAQKWTLHALAHHAGLSRSAFAPRFHNFVGVTPMEYLARWRIQLAAGLLHQGVGIAQVADQVGYQSEETFNRVFKRVVGAPPGVWRRSRPNGTSEAVLR